QMPDVLELIKNRRSLRMPFDPERPVSKEHLADILEAARWSPTAHNMQNFEVVVVDDKDRRSAANRAFGPPSEMKPQVRGL
ncbi:MAG TPA: nitroreductase family protein, partial [Tepidiformaceae bacterium]